MRCRTAVVILALASAAPAFAQQRATTPGTPQPGPGGGPTYAVLRQDEDWRAADEADRLLRVFAISENAELTIGTDAFARPRYFRDQSFGDFAGEDAFLNMRLNVHASLDVGDRIRVFGALKHGSVVGRRNPSAAIDEDALDLHQAFLEIGLGETANGGARDAIARVGRQELHYGSGRLISIREGPNVRSDFDGVLLRGRARGWIADALFFYPVMDARGMFDNQQSFSEPLWGIYASGPAASGIALDLFYVGFERDRTIYAAGSGAETRHTAGMRLWSNDPETELDFSVEGGAQWGEARLDGAQPASIRAWYFGGQVRRKLGGTMAPALGFYFGLSSGDQSPVDRVLETFRAPYPPGNYFGETNPLGPGNIAGTRVFGEVAPVKNLTVTAQVQTFWRVRAADGVYDVGQFLLRDAAGRERFIGHEPALVMQWRINSSLTLNAKAARFMVGERARTDLDMRDIGNVELGVTFRH